MQPVFEPWGAHGRKPPLFATVDELVDMGDNPNKTVWVDVKHVVNTTFLCFIARFPEFELSRTHSTRVGEGEEKKHVDS